MKILKNSKSILINNSGESIAEVLVAFVLLTIIMVIFAQGLAFATNSQANAKESRDAADASMKALQSKLILSDATVSGDGFVVNKNPDISNTSGINTYSVTPYTYTYTDGTTYVVFLPQT